MAKHRKTVLDRALEDLAHAARSNPEAQARLVRVDRVLLKGRGPLLARTHAKLKRHRKAALHAPGLAAPPGLSAAGLRAHRAIVAFLKKHKLTYTGSTSSIFYSTERWRERGELYAQNAVLIVTYDGGAHRRAFTFDEGDYAMTEALQDALAAVGMYFEESTGWYGGVYPRD